MVFGKHYPSHISDQIEITGSAWDCDRVQKQIWNVYVETETPSETPSPNSTDEFDGTDEFDRRCGGV